MMRNVGKRVLSFLLTAVLLLLFCCTEGYREDTQTIQNLRAFAKLYGYLRYFHPSDEASQIECTSWYYLNSNKYGSPKQGQRQEKVLKGKWNDAKTVCSITLDKFQVKKEKSSDSSRVYRINLSNTEFGKKHGAFFAKAYYTLHIIPTP